MPTHSGCPGISWNHFRTIATCTDTSVRKSEREREKYKPDREGEEQRGREKQTKDKRLREKAGGREIDICRRRQRKREGSPTRLQATACTERAHVCRSNHARISKPTPRTIAVAKASACEAPK